MKLTSTSFKEGETIPEKYSRKGGNASPQLAWEGAPKNTKSFALVVDDPDAPSGNFVHWLLYDIPASTTRLEEGATKEKKLSNGALQGQNGFGAIGYDGPQPPSGTHRYIFHLYALDSSIALPPGATREQMDTAIRQHVLDEGQLTGKYMHR